MNRWLTIISLAGAVALLASCSSGPRVSTAGPSKIAFPQHSADPPSLPFPSPEALDEIAELPLPGLPPRLTTVSAPFAVPGPHPKSWQSEDAVVDGSSRFLSNTLESLALEGHRATAAGRCVARALAQFVGMHGARPEPGLRMYILGKCKAVWTSASMGWLLAEEGDRITSADWRRRVTADLQDMIRKVARNRGPIDYGLATIKVNGRMISLLAYGRRGVELSRVERRRGGASFRLRGRLLRPARDVIGMVNVGPTGVEPCSADPKVGLPTFVVTCPTAVADQETWIEIGAVEDRSAGTSLGRVLVSPKGSGRARYEVPRLTGQAPPARAGRLKEWLVSAINEVRTDAGLEPVMPDDAQSDQAAALAPFYFGRNVAGLSDPQDVISMGLRAGWRVDAVVRYGQVVSASTPRVDDPSHLLGALFLRPHARQVLMDPNVERIALASVRRPDRAFSGALVATYAVFESEDVGQLASRVTVSLDEVRAEAGRGPHRAWGVMPDVRAKAAAALVRDELTGADAAEWLGRHYGPVSQWGVRTFALNAHRIDELRWPDALVEARAPMLDLVVAYRRPRGHAWAKYEVIVLLNDG